MGYEAKIIADSITLDSPGVPLLTFQITFPRIVLAEFNTHRVFSRNSASSRAIPVEKMIQRVLADPFISERWPVNGKGMQAQAFLEDEGEIAAARRAWIMARDSAVDHAHMLLDEHGVHKQITNRLLEPFMWHTVIVSSTEWANFFGQRQHKHAQPEIKKIADMMRELYDAPGRVPRVLTPGEWHLPYIEWNDEIALAEAGSLADKPTTLALISSARCARVSYLNQAGKRDLQEDINMASNRLQPSGHMSPFEHAAKYLDGIDVEKHLRHGGNFGNFRAPWLQYRKTIPGEAVFVPRDE